MAKREQHQFPWRELMALGLGRLRLDSASFWAMTPRELASAIEGLTGLRATPPDRAMLEALMRRFPDGTATDETGAYDARHGRHR